MSWGQFRGEMLQNGRLLHDTVGSKTSITRGMMLDQPSHELVELSVHQFKSVPILVRNQARSGCILREC